MIVCVCEAVSDRTIRKLIAEGKSTPRALRDACGAGSSCGQCACDVRRLLAEERERHTLTEQSLAAK